MNIVIDLRPLLPGKFSGVENYAIELSKALISNFPADHFILWSNNFKKNKINFNNFLSPNVEIVQTRIPNKILNLSLSLLNYPKIDKLLHKKVDLIWMPDLRPISSSKHYRLYCTIHDLSFLRFPHFFSLKSRLWYRLINLKKLIKKFTHIFTVSNFSKQEIINQFKITESNITVTYPGTSPHFLKKIFASIQAKYSLPEKYLLSLSTIEPRKNIKNTLLAFKQLHQKHPELHLVVAGIQNPKLFAKNHLIIPPNTHFPGFIDQEDKYSLYYHSLGLIYLSIYEGFGLPIIEAAQAQIPILTAAQTATKEIAPPNALLVNPNSVGEIIIKMEQLLKINKPVHYEPTYLTQFDWQKAALIIGSKFFKN